MEYSSSRATLKSSSSSKQTTFNAFIYRGGIVPDLVNRGFCSALQKLFVLVDCIPFIDGDNNI
jgi:hypothetical protein